MTGTGVTTKKRGVPDEKFLGGNEVYREDDGGELNQMEQGQDLVRSANGD